MSVNAKRTKSIKSEKHEKFVSENSHKNYMDGESYFISNPINNLRIAASSCFFGEPMYYQDKGEAKTEKPTSNNNGWVSDYLSKTLSPIGAENWSSGKTPSELLESAIDKALDFSVEETLKLAVELRNSDNIRTTPQVILVRAANHKSCKGTNLISKYGTQIVSRADEPSVCLAYQLSKFGKPIPNSLKRLLKNKLESFDDYRLAKYRVDWELKFARQAQWDVVTRAIALMEAGMVRKKNNDGWHTVLSAAVDRNILVYDADASAGQFTKRLVSLAKSVMSRMENRLVKTVDVVNIVHAKSSSIDKLCKGELKLGKEIETWESLKSSGKSWEECVPVMGHMALLRNLRNFEQNNVDPNLYLDKLISGAKDGKQLPFRYFSAYQNVSKNPRVLDAIEQCMRISLSNIPTFSGKSISLCDNSGSARGTFTSSYGSVRVNEIANLSGVITAMNSDEGYVGIFGDKLDIQPVRKSSSIFDTLDKLNKIGDGIGASTENGIWVFFRDAINKKEHYDNIFIYSDMQAGHGGLYGTNPSEYKNYLWGSHITNSSKHIDVAGLVNKYRETVNRNVNVFLVQVAGYQDTIIPEFYDRTYILGGWSDGVLRFADRMIKLSNNTQN